MLMKTGLLFCLFNILTRIEASSKGTDVETSASNVKEITVAIEQNLDDRHSQSNDKSRKNSPSQRTRANLLLNSKFIYPSGSRRAAAFNQGILKFQQLLDLPINATASSHFSLDDFGDNNVGDALNISKNDETIFKKIKDNSTENMEIEESENTAKVIKKKFIEDFESSKESIKEKPSIEKKENDVKHNQTVEVSSGNKKQNQTAKINSKNEKLTQDVETITPVTVKPNNETKNETRVDKSSIEILDDDEEDRILEENSFNSTKISDTIGNQTSYLPAKQKFAKAASRNGKVLEVKPQKLEEIPLKPFHTNRISKSENQEEKDEISQTIRRDILLGNLNPFFSNPSTSSIRNTNTLFFDDDATTPRASNFISPMNPLMINSFAVDSYAPVKFSRPSFSRLRSKPSKSSGASVETLPSIPISEDGKQKTPSFGVGKQRNSQKATVKTVPALLISQEDKKPKYSSKYKSRSSGAVSSASFSFTPSISKSKPSHSRSKSTSSYSRQRTQNIKPPSSNTFNRPAPAAPAKAPTNTLATGSQGIEVLKSVDYSLPEEVGKSLTKTGPAKFKRTTGFQPTQQHSEFKVQKSLSVDPLTLNLDMSGNKRDNKINPYLMNTQIRNTNKDFQRSKSFVFKPSLPDRRASQSKGSYFGQTSFFQPSLHFDHITESPQYDQDIMGEFDLVSNNNDNDNQIVRLDNFESDMLFKPYFATQSPKSFQLPDSMPFSYSENNVHMIDLTHV